jgi:nitrite reductase/ring-hydroxylating ferredoxin subunit
MKRMASPCEIRPEQQRRFPLANARQEIEIGAVGYYMRNRGSVHCSRHQCPHWRRCEQDFGGAVEA